jgi:hypothetical protein
MAGLYVYYGLKFTIDVILANMNDFERPSLIVCLDYFLGF